jgi:tRNA A37 threonylcarbamoyladenosine dehydratase
MSGASAGTDPAVQINPRFQRLALLTGTGVLEALEKTRVIVFGLGGVGGWCAEALARSGVGSIGLVDSDRICVTNINRQVQATSRAVGLSKVDTLKNRLLDINPRCSVIPWERVFCRETAAVFNIEAADYCIDAIDSLTCKLDLIEYTAAAGVRLFSSMGMAQKLDPTRIKTASIWDTNGCPLARLVRQGLRKRGFTGDFTAVYSDERLPLHGEIPLACGSATGRCLCPAGKAGAGGENAVEWCATKKVINGSAVTVTAAAGMVLASLVIRDICDRFGGSHDRFGGSHDCFSGSHDRFGGSQDHLGGPQDHLGGSHDHFNGPQDHLGGGLTGKARPLAETAEARFPAETEAAHG